MTTRYLSPLFFHLMWGLLYVSSISAQTSLENMNFEARHKGWSIRQVEGFTVSLSDESPYEGSWGLQLKRTGEGASNVTMGRRVGAHPYQGQYVRLRAAMRAEIPDISDTASYPRYEGGFLWLRTDKPGGVMGTLDNMNRRRVTSSTWELYEIIAYVAPDAVTIVFGMGLVGDGIVWVDDVSLDILPLRTETLPPAFHQLTQREGLSSSPIQTLVQDTKGFLWIGTNDGLNRYDGYQFTPYRHHPDDPSTLGGDDIYALLEDKEGFLWIAHNRGLDRLDPKTDAIYHYPPSDTTPQRLDNINALLEDQQGILWIGTTTGLLSLDPNTETFQVFQHDAEQDASLSAGAVFILFEDTQGALWIGTETGLNRLERSTHTFTRYLQGRPIRSITERRDTTLWIGSYQTLFHSDPQRLSFEKHTPFPTAGLGWMNALYEDPDGRLWVGTNSDGLYRIDDATTLHHFAYDQDDPASLSSNEVEVLLPDHNGILWIGTRLGLNKVDLLAKPFAHYHHRPGIPNSLSGNVVFSILEDRNGTLWVGTAQNGLNRLDRDAHTYQHYRSDFSWHTSNSGISALHEDHQGHIWIGTGSDGLFRYNPEADTFHPYRSSQTNPASVASNTVRDVLEDSKGTLWVATSQGLSRYHPETDTFTNYRHHPDDSTSLSRNFVVDLFEDTAGTLWIGTSGGGLNHYDPSTDSFVRYEQPSYGNTNHLFNTVYTIYERPQEPGILWVGWKGIHRFDTQTGLITPFNRYTGDLPVTGVYGILGDEQGFLWFSTDDGIYRFHPDTRSLKHFGMDDGIQHKEFALGSYFKSSRGELFFGGGNGFNAFIPHEIKDNPVPPRVAFTDLKIFNTSVTPGPSSPLRHHMAYTNALSLAHHHNDLTIDYVGLHFTWPEKIQYAYKLEGYEDKWRYVGTQRSATYTGLQHGSYTLHVKAANHDGVWNEAGTSLHLTIHPPWWKTGWAYALYSLLLLGMIYAADRLQRRRLLAKARIRETELEAQASRALADAATAQVRETEARAQALAADNARHQVELEKKKALEQAYQELEEAHTHLQTVQQQLIHTEKMASLGKMTSGIAHEIKNPLNFINNFAEINEELTEELETLLTNFPVHADPEVSALLDDLRSNAGVIARHGKRADAIVRAMMHHASGGQGTRELTNVNALVDEYTDLAYHGLCAQKPGIAIEIERNFDSNVGLVKLIPQEIGRVLLNLLSNAFDALEKAPHPRVVISTHRTTDRVAIRITDNGPGIPVALRKQVFDPFFTTKPPGAGTGLGLSLSYDIITQGHGGSLQVDCPETGGTTMIVTLPA